MASPPDLEDGWIPEPEYELIQSRVPILCVDILPLSQGSQVIGLIRRATYEEGEGWCLVGGAVLRNESLRAAAARHMESTLGKGFSFELSPPQPAIVAEYFTKASLGELHDPRKHAVALIYTATCSGNPRPQGEAMEFRWFARDELSAVSFGFGQGLVVERLLDRID